MRWVAISAVFLLLLALSPTPTSARLAVPGDANGDGVVNLFDLVLVALAYNPGVPPSDARADLNHDGTVNLFDLVTVTINMGSSDTVTPPTSSQYPTNVYTLQSERSIGAYWVRLWQSSGTGWPHVILTLDRTGQGRIQVEDVQELDPLTGMDVTGEGNPDLVIHTFTQGAHCCFALHIYDLGPTTRKVLETTPSNCSSRLANLDGDAAMEVETCDDLFAYRYCSYAGSPKARVILDYTPSLGYKPASPQFGHLYSADITAHALAAQQIVAAEGCDEAGVAKCAVLAVVLDYMYAGYPSLAGSELYRLYPCRDVNTFAAEVMAAIEASPLYKR